MLPSDEMDKKKAGSGAAATIRAMQGGGEAGELIRNHDWSSTSLGSFENWPQSLRSALGICINSNFPIAIYWGPRLVLLYNDAWSPIPGKKHPGAMGKPAIEVWPDIWDDIEPQFQKAFSGEPGGSKDALCRCNGTDIRRNVISTSPLHPSMASLEKLKGSSTPWSKPPIV